MDIVLFFIFIVIIYFVYNITNQKEKYTSVYYKEIPKIIFQTYHDKSKIPIKVYDNIKKYAPNYQHIIYNDKEIIDFLSKNFDKNVVDKFKELSGAHKADLFRYCILYVYGGIYLDIKTELIGPLNKIFKYQNDIDVYSVLSINKGTIYQGIIATHPKNEFFLSLIKFILSTPVSTVKSHYLIFTVDFYNKIKNDTSVIKQGFNKGKKNNYLFIEKCSKKGNDCYDGLDRYGFCCNVYDNDKKIIKTRYSDFPW
jgi:mannosyltransferase OCH1-like enzyme